MNKIIYTILLVLLNTWSVLAIDDLKKDEVVAEQISNSSVFKFYEATNSVTFKEPSAYTAISNHFLWARTKKYDIVYPTIADGTEQYHVGTTEGSLSVSPSGGSIYEVPIKVSPGTSGMEPHLSFVYNSQGTDGLLGMGWSISGTSSISRTSTSLRLDGEIDPVDFDDNDVFTLDGNRLIAINNGTYGADGTEYRTESTSFCRIISYGSTGCGPEKFKVWTKDGLIKEYGYTTDSRIELQGTADSVISWQLNKIIDTKGNYITYEYIEDNDYGEYMLSKIKYTGNNNSTPVLQPYASVEFNYMERADTTNAYILGTSTRISQLLDYVNCKYGDDIVRSYTLSYTYKGNAQHPFVQKIWEKGQGGVAKYKPLEFKWSDKVYGGDNNYYDESPIAKRKATHNCNFFFGDFDGNGLQDFITTPNKDFSNDPADWDGYQVFLANENGSGFSVSDSSTTAIDYEDIAVGDFNGDGLSDFITKSASGSIRKYIIHYAKVEDGILSFYTNDKILKMVSESKEFKLLVGDYNGDAISDVYIITVNESSHTVAFGQKNEIPLVKSSTFIINGALSVYGDYNGDGKTDLMYNKLDETRILTFTSDGGRKILHTIASLNYEHVKTVGDFNGDGKTDYLVVGKKEEDWNDWVLNFATGEGFVQDTISKLVSTIWECEIVPNDLDKDGKTDLVIYPKDRLDDITFYIANSNSNGFYESPVKNSLPTLEGQKLYFGSFTADGSVDILTVDKESTIWEGYKLIERQRSIGNLMTSITNGLGQNTVINYRPLTNDSIYTKKIYPYPYPTYPISDFESPMFVVSSVEEEDGIGGTKSVSYKYAGAKVHKQGNGFLGFSKFTTIDGQTNIKSIEYYKLDYTRCQLFLDYSETYNGDADRLLSKTLYQYKDTTFNDGDFERYFKYVSLSTESKYKLDVQKEYKKETTSYQYDGYGNPTRITSTVYDESKAEINKSTTVNIYENITGNGKWHLGRLTSATVTNKRKNKDGSNVRKTEFVYDPASGMLTTEIIEPGNALSTTKTYRHDVFGNIIASKITDGETAVVDSSVYDSKGRFIEESYNALKHKTSNTYDHATGAVLTTIDPNILLTQYIYDEFGNLEKTIAPDDIQTASVLVWYDEAKEPDLNAIEDTTCYYSYNITSGSDPTYEYYDKYGRVIRKETYGLDGTPIFIDIIYNSLGQTVKQSDPYFKDDTPVYTVFKYDLLGRVTKKTLPDGTTVDIDYDGLTTTTTNALGQISVKVVDPLGNLISSKDNNFQTVTYEYNHAGKVCKITDPLQNATIISYNILGYKDTLNAPDLGITTYRYNAFGELEYTKDANGNEKTIIYDLLGRKTNIIEPEGETLYTYDATTTTLGLLSTVTSPGGLSKTYYYDNKKRNYKITEVINGEPFTSETVFDDYGRVKEVIYPSHYRIVNYYNQYGYLTTVREFETAKKIWEVGEMNAAGQLKSYTLGANITTTNTYFQNTGRVQNISSINLFNTSIQNYSYEYDDIGNLLKRSDVNKGLTEHFRYNEGLGDVNRMNRLTSYWIEGRESDEVTLTYDALGNITYKSDVGNYHYDGARPHAVTSIDNYAGSLANFEEDINYTSFHKVKSITDPLRDKRMEFTYGSGGERRLSRIYENEVLKAKHFYLGHYEKVEDQSGINEIHYIKANNQVIAIYEKKSNEKPELTYLLKDHLGSIAALVKEDGTLKQEFSYDAWGMRRDPQTWSKYNNPSEAEAGFYRGYTGHEHMDLFALVNMNGRVYDPEIGRFLSADPFVQMPDYTQSLNRYSYVLNNPLSLIDPSGYFSWKKFWKTAIPIVVGIGVGILTAGAGVAIAGMIAGFTSGFTGALVNGASFTQAMSAGIIGACYGTMGGVASFNIGGIMSTAFQGWGNLGRELMRSALHGTSQGALSFMQGGKFHHGFLSGSFSSLTGSGMKEWGGKLRGYQRVAVAAAVGGTASELGGGKFANGAITGAFVQMYNHERHKAMYKKLTAAEKVLVKRYPWAAIMINENKEMAFKMTAELFPNVKNAHNNAADAFRHAYFNALNAKSIGAELAYEFGVAHENWSGNPIFERAMDLSNNGFGINTVSNHPCWSNQKIATYIYNSVSSGRLIMIENNRLRPTKLD